MTIVNQGQLDRTALAELIREIVEKHLSGALRLSRSRAKAVVYFEEGKLVFAASNLRAHRLSELLQRHQVLPDVQPLDLPESATDDEVAAQLLKSGKLTQERLNSLRVLQVSDVLRSALLWTEGDWQFDERARIKSETRLTIDIKRLLLESARHLPQTYIASRLKDHTGKFTLAPDNGYSPKLLPSEAFVLSRVTGQIDLSDLLATCGLPEDEAVRAIYGLSISSLLRSSDWPGNTLSEATMSPTQPASSGSTETTTPDPVEDAGPEALFTHLEHASNHYEVLKVDRQASSEEIKDAYHTLARRYHPDRFHQSDATLRSRIDAAFARVGRAYEVLNDPNLRAAYDAKHANKPSPASAPATRPAERHKGQTASSTPESERAESSYQSGLAALKQNKNGEALRLFAQAASLEPRTARYRAEYGRALIEQPETRRIAEIELKAAIALEPANAVYRIMLAELYKALGLRRRAEGEIQRALAVDPKNEAARLLLSGMKK